MRSMFPMFLTLLAACSGSGPGGSGSLVVVDGDGTTPETTDTGTVLDVNTDGDNDGYTLNDGDCDDEQPAVNPSATDIVGDGIDQNCDGTDGFDADGDGHADIQSGGDDCDDTDGFTFPGAIELWYDGKAQGCEVLPGEPWDDGDQDGDGEDAEAVGGTDCVDTDMTIGSEAWEVIGDDIDNNCNEMVDATAIYIDWFTSGPIVCTVQVDDLYDAVLIAYSLTMPIADGDSTALWGGVTDESGSETIDVETGSPVIDNLRDEWTTLSYRLDIPNGFGAYSAPTTAIAWGSRAQEICDYANTHGEVCEVVDSQFSE